MGDLFVIKVLTNATTYAIILIDIHGIIFVDK